MGSLRSAVCAVALVSCAPTHATAPTPVTIPALPAVSVSAARAPVADPPSSALCHGPHGQTHDFQSRGIEDVLFAACDEFVPAFQTMVRYDCEDAAPELARAAGEADARRKEDGLYESKTRDEHDKVLGTAALPLLPATCGRHFAKGVEGDDWGRSVWELTDEWRDCAADPELVDAYVAHLGYAIYFNVADTPVGVWLFAKALWSKLTPLGQQYMRKLVVCEMTEKRAARGDAEERKRLDKYLRTPRP